MENDLLSRLLRTWADEPVPRPPGDLESRVWREIRMRRSRPANIAERLASLLSEWVQWRPAYAAVAVALVIGVTMGNLHESGGKLPASSTGSQTGESLGLGVFSADPPAMPSTLLARQP